MTRGKWGGAAASSRRGRLAPLLLARVLNVVWFGLATVCGVGLVIMAVLLAVSARPHVSLDLPVFFVLEPGAYHLESHDPGIGSAVITHAAGRAAFTIPAGFGWVALAVVAVLVVFVLFVLHQLRRLSATVAAGRPFTPDNAVRVRLIGIAVIVGEAGRAVLEWTISLWLRGHFAAAGINLDTVFAPRVEVLLIGVVIMLLAEILRLGTRLQEDHDLTI